MAGADRGKDQKKWEAEVRTVVGGYLNEGGIHCRWVVRLYVQVECSFVG